MARKRNKKRTHVGANNQVVDAPVGHASARDPKSMVVRIGAGEVGTSISQLATDVRKVMEPGTASRLKERRANKLKDYAVMCGPLGVTHLMLFSRSDSGNTNLRMALAPRGPTMHFRVEKYSLAKDVQKAQKHPRGGGKEFLTPPLLVMNNFTTPNADANSKVPKHLESLATTVFQSLFPPINPQATPLKSIRRVLLLNREESKENDGTFIVNFRHYAITTRSTGVSKQLRRINAAEQFMTTKSSRKSKMPNLGKLEDIADFMTGEGGEGYMTDVTSGSELDTDAEVEVLDSAPRKVMSARARQAAAREAEPEEEENVERRAVKLVELGPRMRLRLTKVEEGLCSGKIMWHEYIHKNKDEIKELEKRWEKKRAEKDARKQEQKANVEKKKAAKAANGGKGDDDDDEDEIDYSDMDVDDYDSEGLEGDAEFQVNERMEDEGEWEDEEEEIANGA